MLPFGTIDAIIEYEDFLVVKVSKKDRFFKISKKKIPVLNVIGIEFEKEGNQ